MYFFISHLDTDMHTTHMHFRGVIVQGQPYYGASGAVWGVQCLAQRHPGSAQEANVVRTGTWTSNPPVPKTSPHGLSFCYKFLPVIGLWDIKTFNSRSNFFKLEGETIPQNFYYEVFQGETHNDCVTNKSLVILKPFYQEYNICSVSCIFVFSNHSCGQFPVVLWKKF